MSLKDWISKIEASQINETATLGMQGTSTSTATAPKMGQKVLVKPGTPQQSQQSNQQANQQGNQQDNSQPVATMTTQAGKTIAHGDAAQLKKLGDLVNTGGITMTDPVSGKPIEEGEVMEVAPPGMEDKVLALKKKFPGEEGRAYAIAWSQYNKKHGKKDVSEEVDTGQYDAMKSTPSGQQDDDVFKKFREKVRQYGDELEQRQREKNSEVSEGEDLAWDDPDLVQARKFMAQKELERAKTKLPRKPKDEYERKVEKYLKKKHDNTNESVAEGKEMSSKQLNEGALADILANFPHEHKQCQEGWGMDESLYEALCDHYYKDGRIPRVIWHGPLQELRKHVEQCYTEDTMPIEEGEMGADLGKMAGTMVGSRLGPIGSVVGGAIGANIGDKIGDAISGVDEGMLEENEVLHPETYDLIDEYIAKIEPDADREEIAKSIIAGYTHPSELEYALQDDLDSYELDEQGVAEANIQPTGAKSRSHIGNLSSPTTNSVVHPSSGKEIGIITKQPNGEFYAHPSSTAVAHSQGRTFATKDEAHQFIRNAHAKAVKNGTLSNKWLKSQPLPQFAKEQSMAEDSLNEFAPPGSGDDDGGFDENTLKRLAAQWWNGDEDPRVESTLAAAGWEIGQDEGYDNGGVFVVRVGDENGRTYTSWPAEELEELMEGSKEDFTQHGRQADPRLDRYATDPKPSMLGKVAKSIKSAGAKVMDKLHPSDEELRRGPVDEESSLERDIRDSAMRKLKDEMDENMYESKKPSAGLSKEKKSAVVKKAKAGGDIGKAGKGFEKVEKAAAKGGAKDPKAVAAAAMWKNIKREDIEEGETIEKRGGRVHKGTYGTSHEAGDEGVPKVATQRGRGRPKKNSDDSGEVKKYDSSALGKAFGGGKLPKKEIGKLSAKNRIKTKADSEEFNESAKADPMMESWNAQLTQLLAEGVETKAVAEGKSISVSMGQEGGQDSVTVSATDEDAQELLKMLQMSGISQGQAPHQAAMAIAPSTDGTVIDVEPATQDEVISDLSNASQEDDNSALEFIKKMMGQYGHHGAEQADGQQEVVDEVSRGEYIKQQDDEAEKAGKDKFKAFGQEFDTDEVNEEDANGDNAEEQEEMASDATRDAALAQAYSADQTTNKDTNVAVSEEEAKEEMCESCGHMSCQCEEQVEESRLFTNLLKMFEETSTERDDKAEKAGKEVTKDIEYDDKKDEAEKLDEWANSPQGGSDDETFTTDIDFMTKFISGGLNNIKHNQTTVPSAQVVTQQEATNADESIAQQLRKLAGIN